MKVVLTKYHDKLGDVGDVVEVKSGYASNYLIPNELAVPATSGNINQMELVKKAALKMEARNIEEAEEFAKKLENLTVAFIVKTGKEGKLYGSITSKDIAEKISEQRNIEMDRKKIDLQEHIKELGEYDIELKLYKEIKSSVKVLVEPDEESKELIKIYKEEKEKTEAEEKEKQKAEEKEEKEESDKEKISRKKDSGEKIKKEKKEIKDKSKDK